MFIQSYIFSCIFWISPCLVGVVAESNCKRNHVVKQYNMTIDTSFGSLNAKTSSSKTEQLRNSVTIILERNKTSSL